MVVFCGLIHIAQFLPQFPTEPEQPELCGFVGGELRVMLLPDGLRRFARVVGDAGANTM